MVLYFSVFFGGFLLFNFGVIQTLGNEVEVKCELDGVTNNATPEFGELYMGVE